MCGIGETMGGNKYDDVKKEIRSVLLTYKDGVELKEFVRDYKSLLGQCLPSRELGFSSDIKFLESMPDVVSVKTDLHGRIHLDGIADKASEHIQKLVSKQRTTKSSGNNKRYQSGSRQPVYKSPNASFNSREREAGKLKVFLPGSLRAEIFELMKDFDNSITLSSFVLAYQKKFRKNLNLTKGFLSLEAIIKLIPELEIVEGRIHNRGFKAPGNGNESYGKSKSSTKLANGGSVIPEKNYMHKSGIPEDVLKEFQMILQKFPNGIENKYFPILYQQVTGKDLDLIDLGFNSLTEVVEALPNIFKYDSNSKDHIIYPVKSHLEQNQRGKRNLSGSSLAQLREDIPYDVSLPTLQYSPSTIPEYINLSEFTPVFICAIANPFRFWFQLQTEEFVEELDKLEKDLNDFYSDVSDEYKMKSADFAIGATCVIQCPEDRHFYRAVIMSIPSGDLINVTFVDYGSRNNVSRNSVYYVWSKLHEYPTYAFKSQLAGLKPAENANSWGNRARNRFVELCKSAKLMARIKPVDEDTYSVCLCDTNGDTDIFLHATLINEGYAEYCLESSFDLQNNAPSEPDSTINGYNSPVDSENDMSTHHNSIHSNNGDIFSETNELFEKSSPSSNLQSSLVQPNAFHIPKDKLSKRYVKQVEICEGSKIHLINLESKLFMSCDELSSLLWIGKNAHSLIIKLKNKEIDIPLIRIKKEDFIELFKQCLWYKVPGFNMEDSDNSSVILCPIKEAFKVLNIFGHPSVCLRIIIQHETKTFDPHNEFWNDFAYEESLNLSSTDILKDINKLCLYDLKMKAAAFKMQKLKLLEHCQNTSDEKIKSIEYILNVITKRMKQIEEICTQYSSCP